MASHSQANKTEDDNEQTVNDDVSIASSRPKRKKTVTIAEITTMMPAQKSKPTRKVLSRQTNTDEKLVVDNMNPTKEEKTRKIIESKNTKKSVKLKTQIHVINDEQVVAIKKPRSKTVVAAKRAATKEPTIVADEADENKKLHDKVNKRETKANIKVRVLPKRAAKKDPVKMIETK